MTYRTITILVERKLSFAKIIAASHDRQALLNRAEEEWLSVSRTVLDLRGQAKIDELTEAHLEEIEVLPASEGRRLETTTERTET
jgi:hypothetical protein